jgi:hypothetical protein
MERDLAQGETGVDLLGDQCLKQVGSASGGVGWWWR